MDTETLSQTCIHDILSRFRFLAWKYLPYMSAMTYGLQPVMEPACGTMAVDKDGRLYWSPEWVAGITDSQGAYTVLHEVSHLVLRHHARSEEWFHGSPGPDEQRDLNIAADIVVYELLIAIKEHAPEGIITTEWAMEKYPGVKWNMTLDQLYDIIHNHQPEQEDDGNGQSDDQGSDDQGTGESQGQDGDPESGSEEGGQTGDEPSEGDESQSPGSESADGEGEGKGTPIPGGSCADGVRRDYELPPEPSWQAHVEDNLMEKVLNAIEEHEKTVGQVPGAFKESIKAHLYPQPDPWKQLRSAVAHVSAKSGTTRKTYRVRNRKQASHAFLRKGTQRFMPKAALVLDTSGSMSAEELGKGLAAVNQGVRTMRNLHVVQFDGEVQSDELFRNSKVEISVHGRGGTDMTAGLNYAYEKHQPSVMVLITDGFTGWPSEPYKNCQVVAGLTNMGWKKKVPSWVKVVDLSKEGSGT